MLILRYFPQYFVPKDPKLPVSKSNLTPALNNFLKLLKIKILPIWHDACKIPFGPLRPHSPIWIKNEFFQQINKIKNTAGR